jgi:asparagine synthase (glutamine-hydrolysing)
MLAEHYANFPRWLREGVIEPVVEAIPESADSSDTVDHLKRFVRAASADAPDRYQDSMASLQWPARSELYRPDVLERMCASQTAQVISGPFSEGSFSSTLERALRTDLQTYLMDDVLTLSDRLGMWHSLELRVPFLDHRLVELVARMPSELKIRRFRQKYLLKRIAERWLPRDMIYRKKQGFEAPMGHWLRGPLLGFFDSVMTRKAIERDGLFDFDAILKLRGEHVARRKKHSKILFSLLMFQLWHSGATH